MNLHADAHGPISMSKRGFITYPLSPCDANYPNYKERIQISDHFYVAEIDNEVRGYIMNYTFSSLRAFKQLNNNDKDVIRYFIDQCGFCDSMLYGAQIACTDDVKNTGLMRKLALFTIKNIKKNPAYIAEIALSPIPNLVSRQFAESIMKLKLVGKRKKDGGKRLSGTFLRTF